MKIVQKSITELKPYSNNPRKNDQAVKAVAASIREFGFKVPIVITPEMEIIAGHTRLKAAESLGLKKVPCIIADDLSPEQIKAFRRADNKTAELAEWDTDLLMQELADLSDIDMSEYGFDLSAFSEEGAAGEIDADEFDDTPPEEPRTQRGEVWELGEHRLMCGDSSSGDLETLMGRGKGHLVFTDPPYGVSIGDKNKMLNSVQKAGHILTNIENDTLGKDDLYDLLVKCFTNLREHCREDASYYVTSPQGGEIGLMMMMMRDAGLEVRHNLIWKKNAATFSMGRLDYDYQHEPIFYTWTKKHNFYGEGYQTTVWEYDKPRKCNLHPTMKPVELIVRAIENSSKKGDIVVDIFGGSGSTLIACEQTGRKCRIMEIDPKYCDVIIRRWEDFTGQQAHKIET